MLDTVHVLYLYFYPRKRMHRACNDACQYNTRYMCIQYGIHYTNHETD